MTGDDRPGHILYNIYIYNISNSPQSSHSQKAPRGLASLGVPPFSELETVLNPISLCITIYYHEFIIININH